MALLCDGGGVSHRRNGSVDRARRLIQRRRLDDMPGCGELRPWHSLVNLEYVLQEELKEHVRVRKPGYIGDTGSGRPGGELVIENNLGRPFLKDVLPARVRFAGPAGMDVT